MGNPIVRRTLLAASISKIGSCQKMDVKGPRQETRKAYLALPAFLGRDSANIQNCPMDILK